MRSAKIKVLLVEDDDVDAAAVARLAKATRTPLIDLVRVDTLSRAINYLEAHTPDVLLLDLSLPDSERLKGLIDLRKMKTDLPIVVFTGTHDEEMAFEALRHGAQDFINKEQVGIEGFIARTLIYAIERQQLVTELGNARQAALAASKMKSEFLANMSHEIRTPLNGVIGMTALLLDSTMSEQQRDRMQTIRNSADALLTIINDILDFSKIEAGKIDLETIDFNLIDLFREIESNFAFALKNKGISFIEDWAEDLPVQVKGDSGRLRQVLTNLIGNAIKFTSDGHVRLKATATPCADERINFLFEIEDTGIGIPPSAVSRMFQPFSQADASTVRKFGGTGLGLSISKGLVERMGGEIGVRSNLERGSTFWFCLNLKAGGPVSMKTSKFSNEIPSDIFRGTVLIAEDNITNQKIAEAMLEKMGLRVHAVANGNEVLDALREFSFDLILMDCQMPEMDGYEASSLIRKNSNSKVKGIPIIALTAHATSADKEKCLSCGMTDYLSKPVYPSELAKKIEPWVSKRVT